MPPRNNVDNRQMGTKRNEEGERENERMKKRKREGDRSTAEEDIREKRECKVERKEHRTGGKDIYIYIYKWNPKSKPKIQLDLPLK